MDQFKLCELDNIEPIIKAMNDEVSAETLLLLIDAADKAKDFAYAPYSKFRVGAALLTEEGKIITGSNVENASYGLSICAERCAVWKAVSSGERNIKLAVVTTDMESIITPCGACRQVLTEFNVKHVVMFTVEKKVTYCTLEYLIPAGPALEHLKK